MKYYNTVFDIFLYESFFVFLFGGVLYLIEDPASKILFNISIVSFAIAIVLGIIGYCFNLFQKEDTYSDF